MISCSNIERTFGEGQFDTAIIHIGLNDLLNYTTVTEVLLQNVLIIADMQNAWYQQDFFKYLDFSKSKCFKYTQSFKWYDCEVEFRYWQQEADIGGVP